MIRRIDPETQSLKLDSSMMTMAGFAEMLTNVMQMSGGGRQVVDMTGLKGNYQVSVEIALADLIAMGRAMGLSSGAPPGGGAGSNMAPASEASDPTGNSTLYESVEKLGLKLETRKAPVEQLVIDHIEKAPTEN